MAFAASILILTSAGWAQNGFRAQLPMAVTSCGQSPDAYAVSLLCKRAKLEHTFNNVLKPEGLKEIKTLIVVMGGSAKGLGEAGIDEKAELERVGALLAKAKESGIKVIAVHVGGESRRGPLSDKFVTPVISRADHLIVTEDGNKDGLFTRAAKDRNIALAVVKQLAEVGKELKALF
jgi:hypothetical protein